MKTSKNICLSSNNLVQDLAQETSENTAKVVLLGTKTLDIFTWQAWIKNQHGGLVFQPSFRS